MTGGLPQKIIPRWEWRTFANNLDRAQLHINTYACTRRRKSSELYIISNRSNNNIKIREGRLDIKLLDCLNSDHLERWVPVMKASFPIDKALLLDFGEYSKLDIHDNERDNYSQDQFLDELVTPEKNLTTAMVVKTRNGYLIDGAIVEIADLRINATEIRTAAVEHVNPQLVIETVRNLELNHFQNINYITAIKKIINW